MEKFKSEAVKDTIQILFNKGFFDSFEIKDQIFETYLIFTDEYFLVKYGTENQRSDGLFYRN